MKLWEYEVITLWGKDMNDIAHEERQTLSRLGLDGWELVSTSGYFNPPSFYQVNLYFKKPITEVSKWEREKEQPRTVSGQNTSESTGKKSTGKETDKKRRN